MAIVLPVFWAGNHDSISFNLPFEKFSLVFYIFLMANIPFIFGGAINLLGHYWSLGVEEQFYSFWPWIIKKSRSVLKSAILLCAFLIGLKIILRYIDITTHAGEMTWPYEALHTTRFQCMLIGAIGAILYFERNSWLLKVSNNLLTQSLSWFVIMLIAINKFHIISFLDNEIISVITVFIIIGQIMKTKRVINLEKGVYDFIGKISYGIYVIHPLVIFYLTKTLQFSSSSYMNYIIAYLVVFLTTILLAYISYEYFEKRFLALKEKYTTIKSSGTKDFHHEKNH